MSDFTQDRSGHWYTADGKPCHTQPDGKKTTLRHARKQNLLPSVTSILSIIPKHTVDDWRVEQAVLATMQCMVQDGASTLTAQEMMAKVASRLEDATSAGRKFGSEMHSIIEHINNSGTIPPALSPLSSLHPEHAVKYAAWLSTSGIDVEQVEVPIVSSYDRYGYGGCIDLVGRRRFEEFRDPLKVIVDFKTQKVKNGKPKFYPEWAYQLAAYRNSFRDTAHHRIRCMSVVIDSETGQIWEQVWPNETMDKAFTTFCRAFMLWMSVRDYYPYLENTRRAEPAPVLFSEVAGWAGLDMEVGNRTATEVNASALTVAQVRAAQEQMNQMVEEYQRWPAPTPTPSSPIFSGAWEDRPTIRH